MPCSGHYNRAVNLTTDPVFIDESGNLHVNDEGYRRRLSVRTGGYQMVTDIPGLLVLRREVEDKDARAKLVMAGEIIHRMTIMEVTNMVMSSSWEGELHIFGPEAHRVLVIDQGGLRHAKSTSPDDKLGEVLFRMGLLKREQIDDLLRSVSADRRLGELLLRRELLDTQQLFQALRKQAEQVFYNALLVSEGHYLFAIPSEERVAPEATVHIPIQGLLLEGVQRIDEMALFRERIPNAKVCPVAMGQPKAEQDLDEEARKVLTLCNGEADIEAITRLMGLSEFQVTKAIFNLLRLGLVALSSGRSVDQGAVRRLVLHFNDIMQDIFIAVATFGKIDRLREALHDWLDDGGLREVLGGDTNAHGALDPEKITRGLTAAKGDAPLETLHQALHEFAAFALFAATTSLPRDRERDLANDVTRRLNQLKLR